MKKKERQNGTSIDDSQKLYNLVPPVRILEFENEAYLDFVLEDFTFWFI